ncbi:MULTISPECIES: Rdx family protein [unclassified Bradyrhizobium]|uniref:Rdx family protein n=1 Tax=unclassified Bradyrhizobium TaxID=2631580 RepID=UPI00247AD334|nr:MULTISPECIES: Rdx family protein [unclassified Bradyrhizobium]WGS21365.1 Rdx family protein [Bradyrhizobium sp. ISRA463]WGS28295.1 Rdx family protein [Bradyrhizobium sp. ISRA464]
MTHISITYCRPCGYEKRAREAAALLRERLGLDAELVPGKGGVFEVKLDGKVVATRTKGHFPDAAEIVTAVASARA